MVSVVVVPSCQSSIVTLKLITPSMMGLPIIVSAFHSSNGVLSTSGSSPSKLGLVSSSATRPAPPPLPKNLRVYVYL